METVVGYINNFVSKITPRDDVSGRLEVFHLKDKPEIKSFGNYFTITELCLPSDTFAQRNLGKIKSKELKKILAQGDRIHAITQNWLKQHSEYCGSEATLDGNFIGIPARGRVDGRIEESIVEIKSCSNLPENVDFIIKWSPQYLEQVAFYSIIDPLEPKENYLVFVTKEYPHSIKAFKLTILDREKIKNILKKRIHLLRQLLEGKQDAEMFGKCRYCYINDCNVEKEGKCNIKEFDSLNCEIKDFIKLEEDKEFTSHLENLKKEFGENYLLYSSYNLLCPRKYCLKNLLEIDENFIDKNSASKVYFGNLIYQFRRSESSFDETIPSKFKNFELNKYNWFKDKNSIYPDGKKTPFITHVTNYPDFDKPNEYKIAELGLNLMAHGLSRGMIFSYFPDKNKIKVFEITFDFKGDYLMELEKIMKGLENPENFKNLPKCAFGCKTCDYRNKCLN